MSSGQSTFRVVFWGEVTLGHEKSEVEKRFAKWFKVSERKVLDKLFSGRLLTLKKGLGYNDAKRYCDLIRSLGAMCRLEKEYSILEVGVPEPVQRMPLQKPPATVQHPALKLLEEESEDQADDDNSNPFAARELTSVRHPPIKYYDPQAADALLRKIRSAE